MTATIEMSNITANGNVLTNTACSTADKHDFISTGDDKAAWEPILMQEIGYIYNNCFDSLTRDDVETEMEQTALYEETEAVSISSSDFPAYLASLYEIPLLTAEGERVLFRGMNFYKHIANQQRVTVPRKRRKAIALETFKELLNRAEYLRQQIVRSNLRLVVSIARKYAHNQQQLEEMICEGNIILMKAVDKFDYALGYRFSTYVTHSVQRHLFRYMKKRQRIRKTEVDFPDLRAYENLGMEAEEDVLRNATEAANNLMNSMEEVLDEREQFLIRERFGFTNGGKTRTLKSLAGDMGICKERVRQLLNKALVKLNEFATEHPRVIHPS